MVRVSRRKRNWQILRPPAGAAKALSSIIGEMAGKSVKSLGDAASSMLRGVLPEVSWLLRYAEKEDNWIRFPPVLARALSNGNLGKYVEMYMDERRLVVCMVFGLVGEQDGREVLEALGRASIEDQVEFATEVIDAVDNWVEEDFRLPRTEEELEAARANLAKLAPDERERVVRRSVFFTCGFLASFFQYLSVMVHGEKLTALVERALRGDDEAFVRAAQIDRNLLLYHPYFQSRVSRAHLEGDAKFLDALGYRMRNPIAKGQIRYRELWFCLSVLDTLGLLDGDHTHSELIEVLRKGGLDLAKNGCEDEGYFGKRLKDYRRFQARSGRVPHKKEIIVPSGPED